MLDVLRPRKEHTESITGRQDAVVGQLTPHLVLKMAGEGRVASILLVTVVGLWTARRASCYNLEPQEAQRYSYPYANTQGREAYFGFSVALQHNAADNSSWLVVGAPRANSSHHDELAIPEPGAVFHCPISSTNTCEELPIDVKGNVEVDRGSYDLNYKNLKNYGWLGASLDSQPVFQNNRQALCVCAPLWRNQYENNRVNGACYWAHEPLPNAVFKKVVPLVKNTLQIDGATFLNAYGEAGFSVHFPSDSTKMIVGAPGYRNWTGSLVLFEDYVEKPGVARREKRQTDEPRKMFSKDILKTSDKIGQDELLGYAVTSGGFYRSGQLHFAAGAPQSSNSKGKVIIFEFNPSLGLVVQHELQGRQLGEYFGAALAAADINGDGLTDLVVGSPTYSLPNLPDVGRIQVFFSDKGQGLRFGPQDYAGRNVSVARFGTSLASPGDLNADGYEDVVVGAPFEDSGVVYVFLGSVSGLKQKYSQRISPEDFLPGLRGFGMSVSRGIDIDQNGYPDLAIGSFLSGDVVVLRSRPVTVLSGNITANPPTVPWEDKVALSLTTCIHYSGLKNPQTLRVLARFILDHSSPLPRAVFVDNNNETHTFDLDLALDENTCQEHQATVKEDKMDPDQPISMRLEYEILDAPHFPLIQHPVLDPTVKNFIETDVSIVKGCNDTVCRVNMKTQAAFIDGNDNSVVIGKKNKLRVTVSNSGEPVYLPNMTVTVSPPLTLSSHPSQNCVVPGTGPKTSLSCRLSNPIKSGNKPDIVDVSVGVDESQMNGSGYHPELQVHVTGEGEEQEPGDNTLHMSLQLATQAEVEVDGASEEEQISYEHTDEGQIVVTSKLRFNHTYIVIKNGSTPLELVDLILSIPVSFTSGQEFVKVKHKDIEKKFSSAFSCSWKHSKLETGNAKETANLRTNDDASDAGTSVGGGGTNLPPGAQVVEPKKGADAGTQYFNCSSSVIQCAQLSCHIHTWRAELEEAKVSVELELDLGVLAKHISVQGGAVLGSSGTAIIQSLDPKLAFIGKREARVEVVTHIQPESLMGKGVPWWAILLAVLFGLLLLGLLAYGLYKYGFFKREKMEDMKRQRAVLERAHVRE